MSDFAGIPGAVLLGTDTAVGKTAFAAAVLRTAARHGLRPVPFKPVETGDAQPSDALRLLVASCRQDLSLEAVCPHRYAPPVAPALAASLAGQRLELGDIRRAVLSATAHGRLLLVETAGGLLSPYGSGFTSADLAAALAPLPVVLVARNGLGTINHTCLALNEIRRRQLPLAALALVDTTPGSTPDRPHNAALIAAQSGVAPLATLPFVADADPDLLADALGSELPAARLFALLGLPGSQEPRL